MWNSPSSWEKGIEVGAGLILKLHLKNLHVPERFNPREEDDKIQLNCASPRAWEHFNRIEQIQESIGSKTPVLTAQEVSVK